MPKDHIELSVVIPMYREEEVVEKLYEKLTGALNKLKKSYEIILVNDGSTDNTLKKLLMLNKKDKRVKVIDLMGNFGQTAALAAGFDNAAGGIIVTMDGDLQDDPEDISTLIAKLEEGYDIVSGWRKQRKENLLIRRIPSMIANRLLSRISGIDIHDFGAPLKAYRSQVIKGVHLYGQFHRFIPAIAREMRVRIAEVVVRNYERPYGQSKYGLSRTYTVFFDLFRLKFILDYLQNPLKTFGTVGFLFSCLGSIFFIYVFVEKLVFGIPIMQEHAPMFLTSIFLIISGFNFFTIGLLGELIIKVLYESKEKKNYYIRNIYA
jgi:glycosyltransferase involved in cell wall biosynthesis